MTHQHAFEVLLMLLRIVSIFIGGLLIFWELKSAAGNYLSGEEGRDTWEKQGPYSDMRPIWRVDRYPPSALFFGFFVTGVLVRPELWVLIGVALIASAILSQTGYAAVTPILLILALFRIALFRLTDFAPNKHTFLVGNKVFQLIGEIGTVTKSVTASSQGLVRMHKPIFKNDVMDCIADETIQAGEEVKVLEVECGMLKVARTKISD
ncbi:MAG: NfeD family protein [Pseudomonadota bacterium]|nr:NfeD family protein [Pseudomonadota bacterium]